MQYEFKSVQALRGRESSAKAKWQDQGWEFVSENRGTLRTELNFRRVKPKTFGAHLLNIRRHLPTNAAEDAARLGRVMRTDPGCGIIGIVAWGTGASGDFVVMLKAKEGADDLPVFVDESDANGWQDGTKVEMVVKGVEATINGETTDGWLKAQSAKTISGGTTKEAKGADTRQKLFDALSDWSGHKAEATPPNRARRGPRLRPHHPPNRRSQTSPLMSYSTSSTQPAWAESRTGISSG